jgi:hypothetical protein
MLINLEQIFHIEPGILSPTNPIRIESRRNRDGKRRDACTGAGTSASQDA